MGSLPILLRLMAQLWMAVAASVIVMTFAGTILRASSLWTGVGRLLEMGAAFHLTDALPYLFLIAPAIGLYALSSWIDQRS